jgi:hypothetical protein
MNFIYGKKTAINKTTNEKIATVFALLIYSNGIALKNNKINIRISFERIS